MSKFETTVMQVKVVTLYIPQTARVGCILQYAREFGGVTVNPGDGYWLHPDTKAVFITEPVLVYSMIGYRLNAYAELKRLGLEFLEANPEEKCFLATLTEHDGRVYSINITRKD